MKEQWFIVKVIAIWKFPDFCSGGGDSRGKTNVWIFGLDEKKKTKTKHETIDMQTRNCTFGIFWIAFEWLNNMQHKREISVRLNHSA